MESKSQKWTLTETIKGNPIAIILLSFIFTKALNEVVEYGLTYYLNSNNDHPLYTYNYSLGKFGIILAIPAALLSIWIVKIFTRFKKAPLQLPMDGSKQSNRIENHNFNIEQQNLVHSVQENVNHPQQENVLVKRSKIILKIWLKILVFTLRVIYAIVNNIFKFIGNSVRSTLSRCLSNIGGTIRADYNRKKAKDTANWNARQKQKEANHAWRQAAKQGNYNPNTHFFGEKVNAAKRKQREADRAKRNAL